MRVRSLSAPINGPSNQRHRSKTLETVPHLKSEIPNYLIDINQEKIRRYLMINAHAFVMRCPKTDITLIHD